MQGTTSPSSAAPIGIFDSGIGGLTVLRALLERLPHEDFLYFGDTARVPYGTKSPETVLRYSLRIVEFLRNRGVKLLVVACNTASAHALERLAEAHRDLPMVGVIEPGAQAAFHVSAGKRVAVLATEGTIRSGAYRRALETLGSVHVIDQACPLFVPLAEEGWTDDEVTRLVAERYLTPVLAKEVDTAILGCTHYPLLKPLLHQVLGDGVRLVDSAETTAATVEKLLAERNLAACGRGGARYLLTDTANRFVEVGARFLGRPLLDLEWVDL
jgi:glutamate racemase